MYLLCKQLLFFFKYIVASPSLQDTMLYRYTYYDWDKS